MNNSGKIKRPDRFTARVGLLSVTRIAQVLTTFFIFWLYAIRLTQEEYGNFQKIFVVTGFASALISLGLPLMIASLPADKVHSLTGKIFIKNIRYYALVVCILILFVLVNFSFIPSRVRSLMILLSVINSCYIITEIMVIKLGRDDKVFLINILYSALYGGCHYAALQRSHFSMAFLLFLLVLISSARLAWFFVKYVSPIFSISIEGEAEVETYQQQWFFLSLNEVLEAFSKYFDRLFLLWLLAAPAFAVYFNGAYEIPMLAIFISVTGTFINVQARQKNLSDQGILSLFYLSSLQLSFLLFPMFFFLQLNAAQIFDWFFRGKYNESVPIFMVTCWIIPFRIANHTAILQTKLKSELIFRGSLVGLVTKTVLCFILYLFGGAKGVALAVVMGTLVQMIYYLFQTAKVLVIKKREALPFKTLLVVFMISGAVLFGFQKISSSWNAPGQIITGIAGMVTAALIFIFFRKFFLANAINTSFI